MTELALGQGTLPEPSIHSQQTGHSSLDPGMEAWNLARREANVRIDTSAGIKSLAPLKFEECTWLMIEDIECVEALQEQIRNPHVGFQP